MRKFKPALGFAVALAAGTAFVVAIGPFNPTVDGDAQLIRCSDNALSNGMLSFAQAGGPEGEDLKKPFCPRPQFRKESIASI